MPVVNLKSLCFLALSTTLAASCSTNPSGSFQANAANTDPRYKAKIAELSQTHGVPVSLIHRVIMRESKYSPRVVSRGNYGLMQIKYSTAKSMGYSGPVSGLLDGETNLTYAVPYLANAYIISGHNEDAAVRLYAAGYYRAAKQKGLVRDLRTAQSLPVHPAVASPTAVASNEPPVFTQYGQQSLTTSEQFAAAEPVSQREADVGDAVSKTNRNNAAKKGHAKLIPLAAPANPLETNQPPILVAQNANPSSQPLLQFVSAYPNDAEPQAQSGDHGATAQASLEQSVAPAVHEKKSRARIARNNDQSKTAGNVRQPHVADGSNVDGSNPTSNVLEVTAYSDANAMPKIAFPSFTAADAAQASVDPSQSQQTATGLSQSVHKNTHRKAHKKLAADSLGNAFNGDHTPILAADDSGAMQ